MVGEVHRPFGTGFSDFVMTSSHETNHLTVRTQAVCVGIIFHSCFLCASLIRFPSPLLGDSSHTVIRISSTIL